MKNQNTGQGLPRKWLVKDAQGSAWLTGKIRVGKRTMHVIARGRGAEGFTGRSFCAVALAVPLNGYAKLAIEQALEYGDVLKVVTKRNDIAVVGFFTSVAGDGRKVVIDIPLDVALTLQRLGVDDLRNRWVAVWVMQREASAGQRRPLVWVVQGGERNE